jgi:1-acyl-sn-glycerol-3-phosphate acyltransferase
MACMSSADGAPRKELDVWWRIGRAIVGLLVHLSFRIRFSGLERLPSQGPALLACNHVSVLDPIFIAVGVSDRGRIVRYLAAAETFRIPVIGWGLRMIRQIPIRRGARDRTALDTAASVIRQGGLAGIFPEGRVNPEPETPAAGQKGAARLALAAGVPIVPVAIWGPQVRWPKGRPKLRRPWRPVVAVVVGWPTEVDGDPRDPWAVRELTERMMREIAKLLEEAKRQASNRRR